MPDWGRMYGGLADMLSLGGYSEYQDRRAAAQQKQRMNEILMQELRQNMTERAAEALRLKEKFRWEQERYEREKEKYEETDRLLRLQLDKAERDADVARIEKKEARLRFKQARYLDPFARKAAKAEAEAAVKAAERKEADAELEAKKVKSEIDANDERIRLLKTEREAIESEPEKERIRWLRQHADQIQKLSLELTRKAREGDPMSGKPGLDWDQAAKQAQHALEAMYPSYKPAVLKRLADKGAALSDEELNYLIGDEFEMFSLPTLPSLDDLYEPFTGQGLAQEETIAPTVKPAPSRNLIEQLKPRPKQSLLETLGLGPAPPASPFLGTPIPSGGKERTDVTPLQQLLGRGVGRLWGQTQQASEGLLPLLSILLGKDVTRAQGN